VEQVDFADVHISKAIKSDQSQSSKKIPKTGITLYQFDNYKEILIE
jgi:hypothetical protein